MQCEAEVVREEVTVVVEVSVVDIEQERGGEGGGEPQQGESGKEAKKTKC